MAVSATPTARVRARAPGRACGSELRACVCSQARILAQILVTGGQVAVQAFGQAYQKALQNAAKGGGENAARKADKAARMIKGMTVSEAQSILGVE